MNEHCNRTAPQINAKKSHRQKPQQSEELCFFLFLPRIILLSQYYSNTVLEERKAFPHTRRAFPFKYAVVFPIKLNCAAQSFCLYIRIKCYKKIAWFFFHSKSSGVLLKTKNKPDYSHTRQKKPFVVNDTNPTIPEVIHNWRSTKMSSL